MSILELYPYDLLTSHPSRLMAGLGFWSSLHHLSTGNVRVLLVADNLRTEDVVRGFDHVAVPLAQLPATMQWYRKEYEDFLMRSVQSTRVMKVYLALESHLDEAGLAQVVSSYGMQAATLREPIALPFTHGEARHTRLITPDGDRWAVVQSRFHQSSNLSPTSLHRLLGLDFPVWITLDLNTYSPQETHNLLREKDTSARFERSQAGEVQAAARSVRGTIAQMRYEMNRIGATLHTVRMSVLMGGEDEATLQQRLAMVRGSAGLDMQEWESEAALVSDMFSATPPQTIEGSALTSVGATILMSSALTYRRRTETHGILIGTDMHQAPVVVDIFDPRNPSYNMVVLGQPGVGKTFSMLLLLQRHALLGKRLVILDPKGDIDLSWMGDALYHRSVMGTRHAAVNILDMVHDELTTQVEMVIALLGMLGVIDPANRIERALIDEVLMDIYLPIWGRVAPRQVPTLAAVQRRLEAIVADSDRTPHLREQADLMGYALQPYVDGSRAPLFGCPTTVDFSLQHPVTVFDVSQLPKKEQGGTLRAALFAMVVSNISQSLANRQRQGDRTQTLFLIDEIGILMRDDIIASYVSDQFKTARSRGVSMIAVDQDLPNLLGTPDARGVYHGAIMLANAMYAMLYRQKASELPQLRERFSDIPDELLNGLPTMPRGTCIMQLPDDLLRVNITPSDLEAMVFSSRLEDREHVKTINATLRTSAQATTARAS